MKMRMYAAVVTACLGAMGCLMVHAQQFPNTAYGTGALQGNTTGYGNAAFGFNALYTNTFGKSNTAIGATALFSNLGNANTGIGYAALYRNTTSFGNTAAGALAMEGNTSGSQNVAIGRSALQNSSSGSGNTAIGPSALNNDLTGNSNIALGVEAGTDIVSTDYNIDIGNTGGGVDNGVIRIGTTGQQTSFYAAGIDGVQISSGVPLYINSNGQLGTVNSSIRFKEDIHSMADASDKIFELRPVTYRYKQAYADGSKPVDYGLIAEEVAQVYPDMVARDASGEIQTVQYQKLTPMLLNEVQKQHRQLGVQQQTIDMLEQRISALEATLVSAKARTQATEYPNSSSPVPGIGAAIAAPVVTPTSLALQNGQFGVRP